MKILLTGASGFIGSHILIKLIKNFGKDSVVVLTSQEIPNVNCVVYNSHKDFNLRKDDLNNITHIIHAGAFTPKDSKSANDLNACFSNIEYLKELLSFKLINLTRFINLSTLDVYALTKEILSEESIIKPISLYGSSKLYCEEMLKAFSHEKKIDYINLRIGHVYGPGEEKYKKVLPLSIQKILEGKSVEVFGEGDELRSFIFISDVVESIINAIKVSVSNININVVSGISVSIKELLSKLIEISGKSLKIEQKESNHEKRNLVFNNELLLNTLLKSETDLMNGLKVEYEYMKEKYENNI
ncbi:NAD-dependent epimerase/dehydratase family protein [Acinetobacter guillouiae]|uniref:NAD-dependent epimerase/dehydratase family protein n=1 Tax=Acinetobacter guillouiae TaxID=106649 RepID=UPI003AF5F196